MTHKNPAARTTFRINRFMLILVVFLLFFEPTLLKWYCQARYLSPAEQYSVRAPSMPAPLRLCMPCGIWIGC